MQAQIFEDKKPAADAPAAPRQDLRTVPYTERLAVWAARLGKVMARIDALDLVTERAVLAAWPSLDVVGTRRMLEDLKNKKRERRKLVHKARRIWGSIRRWYRYTPAKDATT